MYHVSNRVEVSSQPVGVLVSAFPLIDSLVAFLGGSPLLLVFFVNIWWKLDTLSSHSRHAGHTCSSHRSRLALHGYRIHPNRRVCRLRLSDWQVCQLRSRLRARRALAPSSEVRFSQEPLRRKHISRLVSVRCDPSRRRRFHSSRHHAIQRMEVVSILILGQIHLDTIGTIRRENLSAKLSSTLWGPRRRCLCGNIFGEFCRICCISYGWSGLGRTRSQSSEDEVWQACETTEGSPFRKTVENYSLARIELFKLKSLVRIKCQVFPKSPNRL